jgi:hypothetical protein
MSADARYSLSAIATGALDYQSVRVLRYAAGSTLALTIALAFDWQLAYLTPVLTVSFLASPAPRPSFKMGVGFVLVVGLSCVAGLLLGKRLISYPLVFIPFTTVLLLRLFYVKASGQKKLLMTMLLISLLVIPIIVMSSPAIAGMVARGLTTSALAAIVVIWLVTALIPDPAGKTGGAGTPEPPAAVSQQDQLKTAVISTLTVLPVFVLFYSLQMTDALLILVFVALLSSQPGFATNFKMGAGLILGNAIGAIASILFYQVLVMVPDFGFLIILTLLAGLFFGARALEEKPAAKLWGMAYSTLLLVIGSVTAGGSDGAGAKVYSRVMQIFIAVVYVVMACGVADRFMRRKGA